MVRTIDIEEGKNLLRVLSVIAEHQISDGLDAPKQKDIVAKLPLTKGSVSNNCRELEDDEIIFTENAGRFHIDRDATLSAYREYLEPFFVREEPLPPYLEQVNRANEIRTEVKDNLENILEEIGDLIFTLILSLLADARRDRSIANLREVFQRVNLAMIDFTQQIMSSIREIEGEISENRSLVYLFKLATTLETRYKYLDVLSKSLSKETSIDIETLLTKSNRFAYEVRRNEGED